MVSTAFAGPGRAPQPVFTPPFGFAADAMLLRNLLLRAVVPCEAAA